MGSRKYMMVMCSLSLTACVGEVAAVQSEPTEELSLEFRHKGTRTYPGSVDVDPRRSLVVTDQPILERFTLERVLNQFVAQSRVPGLTAKALFQQWWDTQNPGNGSAAGPHCDDELDAAQGPLLNGFPYSCRPAPAEGSQALCDPFTDPACTYMPIGLFNRFDLAPLDGSTCGEHRIVFAKQTGQTNKRNRNLVIFEAAVPNPKPHLGLEGCRPVANFWAELSRMDDLKERAKRLETFYFKGLGHGVGPVVDIRNFGDNAKRAGQIRTNQFVQDGLEVRSWSLREFRIERVCEQSRRKAPCCKLLVVPDTNKNNPYGPLFSDTDTHPARAGFQASFLAQIPALAATEAALISMNVDDRYNSGQSQSSGSAETEYLPNFADEGSFASMLRKQLDALDSDLTPREVVARAQTQSCAGCHRFSNKADLGAGLTWPSSLGFTHVTETQTEVVDGVARFLISDALISTLLPRRKVVMENFLLGKSPTPDGHDTDDDGDACDHGDECDDHEGHTHRHDHDGRHDRRGHGRHGKDETLGGGRTHG